MESENPTIADASTGVSSLLGALPSEGDIVEGRYRVEGKLGAGGMGHVFEARHVTLDRRVAIKVLAQELAHNQGHKERFVREAKAASKIEHPCIVEINDFGYTEARSPFFVMEYLHGETLAQHLRQSGPLSWAQLGPIALQICGALHAAHQAEVIHRDIKPDNLFVIADTLHVKVVDFGIAKVIAADDGTTSLTGAGAVLGTADYLAPEVILSRPVDARTDLYSLGVSLYQLLVGHLPLRRSSRIATMMAHAREAPEPLPASVPAPVAALIMRCLEKQPDDRFDDARELFEAIRATLDESALPVAEAIARAKLGTTSPGLSGPSPDESRGGSGSKTTLDSSFSRAAESTTALERSQTELAMPAAAPAAREAAKTTPTTPARARSGLRRAFVIAATLGLAMTAVAALWLEVASARSATIDPQHLASFAALPKVIEGPGVVLEERRIELGRELFADPLLSGEGDLACVSCHPLDRYGTDGLAVARGHNRQTTGRNVPSVYNAAGHFAQGWSATIPTIEAQARTPILEAREMANTEAQLLADLGASATYPERFAAAFPDDDEPISLANVGLALGAYERTLVTPAPWDRFLAGDAEALSEDQRRGFNAFVEVGCVQCHSGPYVGAASMQKLGLLRPWPDTKDRGRYEETQLDGDYMVFKVPSLRNVAETGPYFHDGSIADLHAAVRMMAHHQLDADLDDATVDQIVQFLGALTGELPRG